MIMTLHTHVYLVNLFGIHFAVGKWKGCSIMGERERERERGRGEGGGGSWEGEHLDNVNSILQAAVADKPHPKFRNLNFGKKIFERN